MTSKPIAIIGAGIAGLAAAVELGRAGLRALMIDRDRVPGGRMTSYRGDGWTVDTGCPFFRLSDHTLLQIIRRIGMGTETLALQDAVGRLTAEGKIERSAEGFGGNRVALRDGMISLFRRWEREVPFIGGVDVGAIRWSTSSHAFLLRDVRTGRVVREPKTFERLEAGGVVLAVPGPEARRISENSRVLAPLAPYLEHVRYMRALSAIFRIPRIDPGFYALAGEEGAPLAWMAFEERKVGGRTMGDSSVLLARPGQKLLEDVFAASDTDALERIYATCRRILPDLAAQPLESILVRWNHAVPVKDADVRIGRGGIPTEPLGLPIALAGDFTAGPRAEFAAQSGVAAAREILRRLKA
ncbi:FAD-dependent oxidoreductase [bacterium]|nr:FAD-dependent oxidoreductase [bacterium]